MIRITKDGTEYRVYSGASHQHIILYSPEKKKLRAVFDDLSCIGITFEEAAWALLLLSGHPRAIEFKPACVEYVDKASVQQIATALPAATVRP